MANTLRFESEAAYRAHLARSGNLPGAVVTRNKFGNEKTVVNGIRFDSAKEAKRYHDLCLLRDGSFISELQRQITFPLIVNGEQVCAYVADFIYFDAKGKRVIEDVKSSVTRKLADYRIKAKLMHACYGVDIVEV